MTVASIAKHIRGSGIFEVRGTSFPSLRETRRVVSLSHRERAWLFSLSLRERVGVRGSE
jgi:hypothetical protein